MTRSTRTKVAIVGGGVFGSTLALDFDALGLNATLFERRDTLLAEASLANQYRLHRGFHYPRSDHTIIETKKASLLFEKRFQDSVLSNYKNLYAIASSGSQTSAEKYLEVITRNGLKFNQIEIPDFLRGVDLCVESEENLYHPARLREQIENGIKDSNIDLRLSTEFDWSMSEEFDAVVLCTYGSNDIMLRAGGYSPKRKYRVQVVEKPVVKLPPALKGKSLVVMDGAFFSMDPMGDGEYSVIGHVTQAIHYMKEGCDKVEPEAFQLLENLRANEATKSRFGEMRAAIQEFLPDFSEATHERSLWAVRVVPGNVAHTDERPTEVEKHSENVFSVFSGKVSSSVLVADRLCSLAPDLFH